MEITSPVTSTCLGWSTLFEPHFITFLGNYAFSLQKNILYKVWFNLQIVYPFRSGSLFTSTTDDHTAQRLI